MRLTDVFAALGLRTPGSTAIDVPRLLHDLDQQTAAAAQLQTTIVQALRGVLSAAVALAENASLAGARQSATHLLRDSVIAAVPRRPGFDARRAT